MEKPLIQNQSKLDLPSLDSSTIKLNSTKDKKLLLSEIKLNQQSNKLKKKPRKDLNKITFTPQPYRITIKLSGANPSAPAESVTKALRKAGISFLVEKIERVKTDANPKEFPSVSTSKDL